MACFFTACVESVLLGRPCDSDGRCLTGYECELTTNRCIVAGPGSAGGNAGAGEAGGGNAGGGDPGGGSPGGGSPGGGAGGGAQTCTRPSECDDLDSCTVDDCNAAFECTHVLRHESPSSPIPPVISSPLHIGGSPPSTPANYAPPQFVFNGETLFTKFGTTAFHLSLDGGRAELGSYGGTFAWSGEHYLNSRVTAGSMRTEALIRTRALTTVATFDVVTANPALQPLLAGADSPGFLLFTRGPKRFSIRQRSDGGWAATQLGSRGALSLAAIPDGGHLVVDDDTRELRTYVVSPGGADVNPQIIYDRNGDGGTFAAQVATSTSGGAVFFSLDGPTPHFSVQRLGPDFVPVGARLQLSDVGQVEGRNVVFDGQNYLVLLRQSAASDELTLLRFSEALSPLADDAGVMAQGAREVAMTSIGPGKTAMVIREADAGLTYRFIRTCP